MTREEAIKILKAIKVYECYPKSASEETKEAINMAIEALKAPTESTNTPTNTPTDLISRQDAIEAVATVTMSIHLSNVLCDKLLALPSADRPPGWIPVSKRLPGKNKEVLISCEWGVDIGQYDADGWRSEWINHYDDDSVLAWMPLPEPYREDGE